MIWVAHQAGDPPLTLHFPSFLRKMPCTLAGGHRSSLESKMEEEDNGQGKKLRLELTATKDCVTLGKSFPLFGL